MKYLLDTDHISIYQRRAGQNYANLAARLAHYLLTDFGISIISG